MSERPFHCDEAVQAVKFGNLLEEGQYTYDPQEYHGPSLYYISLPSAWLAGAENLADMDEFDLRIVPALFGVGLILLLLLVQDGLRRGGVIAAAVLTGISPFMVYFSRYYIQEMLLIFFTFGAICAGWRYLKKRTALGAVLFGVSIAMMFTTKETCIIAWFSLFVATLLTAGRDLRRISEIPLLHILWAALAAFVTAALFFSSFGTHPEGVVKAVAAFPNYFNRAGGEGHGHPWFYYLKWLFWHKESGVLWTELLILILALYGGVRSFMPDLRAKSPLSRFLVFYTVVMATIYSLIPYKTPWLALGFLHPAILLAGYGVSVMFSDLKGRIAKAILVIALLAAGYNLASQMWRGSFYYYADERNPCVYSHTSTDVVRLSEQLHKIADLHSEGKATIVKVIAREYWPLPWYLRDFEHVGYWHTIPSDPKAPIILTSPQLAEKIEDQLDASYVTTFAGLRPGVMIYALIREDLWENYLAEVEDERR